MIGFRQRVGIVSFYDVVLDCTEDTSDAEKQRAALDLVSVHMEDLPWEPDYSTVRPVGRPVTVPASNLRGKEAFTSDPEEEVHIPPDGLQLDDQTLADFGLLDDVPADGVEVPDDEVEQVAAELVDDDEGGGDEADSGDDEG